LLLKVEESVFFAPIQRDSLAEIDEHPEFSTNNPVQENTTPLAGNN
jgi:hypothetical protein